MLDLADVLAMPVMQAAAPQVVAAHGHLHRRVRWVHTTELADIGPLLRGGDLVLTTGIALPEAPADLARFAVSLAEHDAAGLCLELGRRWRTPPDALVRQCEHSGLPLVALRQEVRFAAVAQAVGERLVDGQLAELRDIHRVHDTFTALSISEAGPEEVLAAVQQLSGGPVVVEDAQHRVLALRAGPEDVDTFLTGWERRSRRVRLDGRTAFDPTNGWLVTLVGRPERRWGRLVIGVTSPPSPRLTAIAERGAAALAMHRLHDRSGDSRTRRLHLELLRALTSDPSGTDVVRRAELAGMPAVGPCVGLALRPATGPTAVAKLAAHLDDVVAAGLREAEARGVRTLIAAFETDVRMLAALPTTADPAAAVDRLVRAVGARVPVVAAAGTAAAGLLGADRTLKEAVQVLAALPTRPDPGIVVHRLADVHVRGLLRLLSDDERLEVFTERELAPLRQAEDGDRHDLLRTARVLLEQWGSKSAAAVVLNVSRPVLYDRITRLERVLGVDLDDAEVRMSLHLALLAAQLRDEPREHPTAR